MGSKKIVKYIGIVFLIVLFVRLFTGIYTDDEFDENYFFVKPKPTLKWYFYSPKSLEDRELTDSQQKEQSMFDEYAKKAIIKIYIPK